MMVSLVLLLALADGMADCQADATDLIKGVYNARSALKSGRQVWIAEGKGYDKLGKGTGSRKRRFVVEFLDGDARFIEWKIVAGKKDEASVKYSVVSGGAWFFNEPGEKTGALMGSNSTGQYVVACDPRTFGISGYQYADVTLSRALSLDQGEGVFSVGGMETIDGRKCVRVIARRPDRFRMEYWIEPAKGFRVWRIRTYSKNDLLNTIESKYSSGDGPASLLPYTFTYRSYTGHREGQWLRSEVVYRRVECKMPAEVGPESFTLAGLNLAVGDRVKDIVKQQTIGYWNGAKIVPTKRAALGTAQPVDPRHECP